MKYYIITSPSLIKHGRVITRRSIEEAETEAQRLSLSNHESITIFSPAVTMKAQHSFEVVRA